MTVSSKTVVGTLAAALMGVGLMSACSTKQTSTDGGTSGGSTGGSCGPSGTSCTVSSECCSPLTCSGGSCTQACGRVTEACGASSPCCSPLVCDTSGDQNNNTCVAPVVTTDGGGCDGGSAPGEGCITLADCAVKSNVCIPASDGGGYCGAAVSNPNAAVCSPNGQACSATSAPCCGQCLNGVCASLTACGVQGQGCNVAGDCCNYFKCVQGSGADNGDGGPDGGDAGACGAATATCAATTDCCSGLICDLTSDATANTCITAPDAGVDAGTDAGTDAGPVDAGTTPDSGTVTYTGTCQPSCGGSEAACDTTNGNADCCQNQGLTCLPLSAFGLDGGATAGLCYDAQFQDSAGNPVFCGSSCSTFPCQLGASCQLDSLGNDPCTLAGFVCDQQGMVCRYPNEQETCVPGGPACQPLAGSTVTDLQCLPAPSKFGSNGFSCNQPCALADPGSGSGDCVDPLMTCAALGGGAQGAECFYNEGCTTSFGACNSAGVGDGVCVPYNFAVGEEVGLCFQATLDGGAPGSACSLDGNRQNGGFCDPTSYCVYGICAANCNAGTNGAAGGPTCAQNDAGPAVVCTSVPFGQNTYPVALGTCSAACDFTSASGGGCTNDTGAPEQCDPPAYFGLDDSPIGICVGGPATAIAVGQPCSQSALAVNTCVDGALCLGNGIDLPFTCVQLCTNVGGTGAPCNTDQICTTINFGTPAAHEGYCSLPDGGFGG